MVDPTLATLSDDLRQQLRQMLAHKHIQLAQLDRPSSQRSITARNYDSALRALSAYMQQRQASLPTRSLLEQWRDDMQAGTGSARYAIGTINARLAAARKLLRGVADDLIDVQLKMALRDWANVADAKDTKIQDKTEQDYGVRLSQAEFAAFVRSIPRDLRGLRDRALVAVLGGAGLRLSEAVKLTLEDVYSALPQGGPHAIRVRRGKHNKSRVVVLGDWDNWVLRSLDEYLQAIGFNPQDHAQRRVFYRLRRLRDGTYRADKPLSMRGAHHILQAYSVRHRGKTIRIAPHDLRRTYAKLCRQNGMSWDALRLNMGHSSVKVTENYVGYEIDWRDRKPNWTIEP
ncbi:MAG: site-specific integrase [Anaerolineae bacterium]|nr:site-specific integrase [Anaerolineae bacterium]MDW8171981.1 site-specific integrase [Anaerolineae bacterium]